jgi:cell pole-organizing protein PopZ
LIPTGVDATKRTGQGGSSALIQSAGARRPDAPHRLFEGSIMTDTTAQEPTMEEILASIRRIISEDDAPAAEAAPVPTPEPDPVEAAPPVMAAPEPEPAVEEEEILDLTDRYEAPPAESIGDIDVHAPLDEPEPEPFPTAFAAPEPAPAPVYQDPAPSASPVDHEALVSETASASAASAFAGLAASFARPEPTPTGGTGPTIDDLARSLLRPMLKDWLDTNLPGIVEAAVKKEVERIARSA